MTHGIAAGPQVWQRDLWVGIRCLLGRGHCWRPKNTRILSCQHSAWIQQARCWSPLGPRLPEALWGHWRQRLILGRRTEPHREEFWVPPNMGSVELPQLARTRTALRVCLHLFNFCLPSSWDGQLTTQRCPFAPAQHRWRPPHSPSKSNYLLSKIHCVPCGHIKLTEVSVTAFWGRQLPSQMRILSLNEQKQLAQGQATAHAGDGHWTQICLAPSSMKHRARCPQKPFQPTHWGRRAFKRPRHWKRWSVSPYQRNRNPGLTEYRLSANRQDLKVQW